VSRLGTPAAWAAGVLVAFSSLHLTAASGTGFAHDPVAALSASFGAAGLLTAVRLGGVGCFESRVATMILAAGTLVGLVLVHTLGAPGAPAVAWSARDVALIGCSIALPLLALSDRITLEHRRPR
jgi:hypothetical protein